MRHPSSRCDTITALIDERLAHYEATVSSTPSRPTATRRAGDSTSRSGAVVLTLWIDTATGELLDSAQLSEFQRRAHVAYEANTHIFEDELDALAALGVVPAHETSGRGHDPNPWRWQRLTA